MVDSNILLGNIILENIKILEQKIINFSTTWIDGNGLKNNQKIYMLHTNLLSIIF